MIKFDHENIKYMALELPDEINFYRFSGDFDGELAAIERYMCKDISNGLKLRLELEKVIAAGMKNDYLLDFDGLLAAVRKTYPHCGADDLEKFISIGHADYIIRCGKRFFQNSAPSNVKNCCKKQLVDIESGCVSDMARYYNKRRHENLEIMQKNGGRAYRYRVKEYIAPKDSEKSVGRTVRVHLPYPCECFNQKNIKLISSSHPVHISNSPHRTAFIEAVHKDGAEYWVEFEYEIYAKHNKLDAAAATASHPDFYLDEQYPQIRFTPAIRALADELKGNENNSLILARRAYDWVTKHMFYSYMREYLYIDFIPGFALMNQRGDCGVMALLFITLCRAMGVPARWQSGSHVEPDSIGSHDWAEFYVEPWGWLPCDPSFGSGAYHNGDDRLWNHYFGNLDVFREINATEFAASFDPPREYLRRDPYDNQSGEIEFADGPLWFGEIRSGREVVSSEELTF